MALISVLVQGFFNHIKIGITVRNIIYGCAGGIVLLEMLQTKVFFGNPISTTVPTLSVSFTLDRKRKGNDLFSSAE